MNIFLLSAFGLYALALTLIGLFFYYRNTSADSFALGNRSINFWVTAIATQASDMGSWLFLGLPAMVFTGGIFESWTAIGLVFFMFLTWHYIAPQLRKKTERLGCTTLPDYFVAVSSGNDKKILRYISSAITLIFFTFYIASGLVGVGRVFESAFGLSYHIGVCVGLAAGALYTLLGGFTAVAWCDMFQGIFLLLVIVTVPLYTFTFIDGVSAIQAVLHERALSTSLITSTRDVVNALLLACSWGLGYFGQPHILGNFMGIDDPKKIKYAKYVGITWQILVLFFAICIGLVSLAFFANTPINPELIFTTLAKTLFHPFITGLILCAIIAATLSSMDSQILLSGSIIAQHLARITHKNNTADSMVWLSRVGSILIALVSLAVAWNNSSSIYALVNYAWSGLGAAFGPALLVTLYNKHVSTRALCIGITTGAAMSALWPLTNSTILPLLPGFLAHLCILLCSLYMYKR